MNATRMETATIVYAHRNDSRLAMLGPPNVSEAQPEALLKAHIRQKCTRYLFRLVWFGPASFGYLFTMTKNHIFSK